MRRPKAPHGPDRPAPLSDALRLTKADKARLAELRAAQQRERQAESMRFAQRFRRPLEDAETRAARGDVSALCQLVAWDKLWLFRDEAADLILRAEQRRQADVLRRVGRALARFAQERRRSPHQPTLNLLRTMQRLAPASAWDRLRTVSGRMQLIDLMGDDLPDSLQYEHTLYVWLRRNGLLPPASTR